MSLAATEARLRRTARSVGIMLQKSRSRTPDDPSFGGYMLTDARMNVVLSGADPWPFSLSLDDVADELQASEEDGAVMGRARDGSWAI